MLIQRRDGGLRLIAQHDHGLLAGELAAGWSGVGDRPRRLSEELVLAVALHDLAWSELDAEPRWNPGTGMPHDFLDFPSEDKYRAAADGIERVSELHPYAGVLVSLHYTTFGSPGRPPEFEEAEEERRVALLDELGDDAPGPGAIRRDLEYLRLLDNLSLFLCLTPPGANPESRPPWLRPGLLGVPGEEEETLGLAWRGEEVARLSPYPFGDAELEAELPYRDLPPGPFEGPGELARAWERSGKPRRRIRLVPG